MTINYEKKPCYDIVFTNSFDLLAEELQALGIADRRVAVIADSCTKKLFGDAVCGQLEGNCKKVVVHAFPAGEAHKTLDTVKDIYKTLIDGGFDRRDLLIALGGGVVGDITGYAAATYLRGVDFVQIPTTLIAQSDSSIGGKTGVDFDSYKNMVGAFHMPSLVYMNLSVLRTLPERQFASGMAEILKHGLIRNEAYYQWLIENQEHIRRRSYEALLPMIAESCKIKRAVVEADPTEQGERALLNFGHTIGHAIEKLSDFTLFHGECVALGMISAGYISCQRGNITKETLDETERILESYGLPTRLKGFAHTPEEILKTTRSDKKMESGKIKFILLKQPGEAYITKEVTDSEILAGIRYILQ